MASLMAPAWTPRPTPSDPPDLSAASRYLLMGMYNPFSLLNTFKKREFNEYWFETGTPTFLVKIMQRTSYDITHLTDEEVDSSLLSTVNTVFENPIPLLYQSGYLTITGYDPEFALYRLGFPNREVKRAFMKMLLNCSASMPMDIASRWKNSPEV